MLDTQWLPTLEGKTISVRPIRDEDFESLYAAASDPQLWVLHSEKDRYQKPVFKKFFDKAAHPPAALVVIDKVSGEIIGSSRYYDPEKNSVVVGYTFLAKKWWGGHVNRELKKLMLDYAFQWVDTVIFHTSEGNFRSQRAIEKLGAQQSEGIIDLPGVGKRIEYRLTKIQWRDRLASTGSLGGVK